jgi:uncharacterized protein (DUF305 family)
MKRNQLLAAGLAAALVFPGVGLAQMADHGAEAEGAPMMQGGMDGMMPEGMSEHMREMMRPMMQEMMREMMGEMQTREPAPEAAARSDADPAGHDAHHSAAGEQAAGSPATEAYRAANLAMHEAMDIEFSDNADIDFARGMIGHHQGAIDMARIVLEHGEDPELRQLAEEIIEAQEAEIAFLQNWLADNAE